MKGKTLNRKRLMLTILLCLLMAIVISACAVSNSAINTPGRSGVAGFWSGLWQGLILPVSFIVSLFDNSINIYEIHNDGNWYNFGFVLGTWIVFGSFLGASRGGRRR